MTATSQVVICQAVSGQTVSAAELGRKYFFWRPAGSAAMHLAWGQGSRSLILCELGLEPVGLDKAKRTLPVQQLCFSV